MLSAQTFSPRFSAGKCPRSRVGVWLGSWETEETRPGVGVSRPIAVRARLSPATIAAMVMSRSASRTTAALGGRLSGLTVISESRSSCSSGGIASSSLVTSCSGGTSLASCMARISRKSSESKRGLPEIISQSRMPSA